MESERSREFGRCRIYQYHDYKNIAKQLLIKSKYLNVLSAYIIN